MLQHGDRKDSETNHRAVHDRDHGELGAAIDRLERR
jgi:hypothetical protein